MLINLKKAPQLKKIKKYICKCITVINLKKIQYKENYTGFLTI